MTDQPGDKPNGDDKRGEEQSGNERGNDEVCNERKSLLSRAVSAGEKFSGAVLIGGAVYGALALIFTVVAFRHAPQLIAVAFFVALASVGLGCVGGFIFGVPKAVTHGRHLPAAGTSNMSRQMLVFNTNLGDVSDWVT